MKQIGKALLALVALVLILVALGAFYTVPEYEQVIITQFGEPMGEPVTEAGLKMKIPVIQDVNRIERRVLEWDGRIAEMPTRDKLYILVDTFGRWRIDDPLEFFRRLGDERSAQSRLDDILGSETRNAVAKHDLIEIIRTTKGRVPEKSGEIAEILGESGGLDPIREGRAAIEKQIFEAAKPKLASFGIELLDIRFKRINYTSKVESSIFERMISERNQIAERFRSEGEGEAARILGNKERDLRTIESEAYKKVQEVLGEADAQSTAVYAGAYGKNSRTEEFYQFTKTLEAYGEILGSDSTVILSTDSELFGLLKRMGSVPAP
ncbi:MAG: protease modulator HflC [Akkermansiaceae bacterium]|nr:protease modulator HflC [Akkermansiaceae bacterium]